MEKLLKEAQEIQDFLEVSCSDDPNEMVERLTSINVFLARTGKMLADAKQLQDKAVNTAFTEYSNMIPKMPATVSSKFINTITSEQNYLVNWLDRLNRACVHSGDNIRTQVSFAKEQMSLTRKGY